MDLQLHPLCTLFPRLDGEAFEALKADIAVNGLRQPVVLHEGMILDGGNRYRACSELGIKPDTTDFDGVNIVSFVLSANLHRRHMSLSQQAAIVASAQDWGVAHKTSGRPNNASQGGISTSSDRAAQSGASIKTQQKADAVSKRAPELAKQVAHGEVSLKKAYAQVSEQKPKNQPAYEPDVPELNIEDTLRSTINSLQDELHRLQGLLAVEASDFNEEGKAEAKWLWDSLTEEKRLLEIERDQLKSARDGLQVENTELKKSVNYWRKKAEKVAA